MTLAKSPYSLESKRFGERRQCNRWTTRGYSFAGHGRVYVELPTACEKVGIIPAITHHDVRHLFATKCIESGVDIQTVSRWLGHRDGEALAMRIYGHLRDHHSREMAKLVQF